MPTRDQRRESTQAVNANATVTGQSYDLEDYERFTAAAFADADGTLIIEQSPNDSDWDLRTETAVSANRGESLTIELELRYARATYENGSQNQTEFRLFTTFK